MFRQVPQLKFCAQEWIEVRKNVDSIDRECECGGFSDFGDDEPLSPCEYDCYAGNISAENIKISFEGDNFATIDFTIKDNAK